MKNLFVILFLFISLLVLGQDTIVYPHTIKYNHSNNDYYPKWPIDTTKMSNGEFSVNRLYIAQSYRINSFDAGVGFYFTVSDSFVKNFKVNFKVDNSSEPTELMLTKTKIKFKLYPNSSSNRFIYSDLIPTYADSVKSYYTDSDFKIDLYYYGNSIEVVNIGITEITENTYKIATTWYNSTHKNKSLSKDQILAMWVDETFLKDFSKYLPNKNYAEELIKFKTFQFSFTNDYQFHETPWDRWFGMMYNYNGGELLESVSDN
jgi:hypothetical protein